MHSVKHSYLSKQFIAGIYMESHKISQNQFFKSFDSIKSKFKILKTSFGLPSLLS